MAAETLSADEARQRNIAAMGEDLGSVYSALWQAVATIYVYWGEYVVLFGARPQRIELLNRAAPMFFRMLQDELWDSCLLHLARLTDPAKSGGRGDRGNLTVRGLPNLILDASLQSKVSELVSQAVHQTEFCRDLRNRRIAHNDLMLALGRPTTPLTGGSRLQIKSALDAISKVLSAISSHYFDSELHFDVPRPSGGAHSLLYVLDAGVRGLELKRQRLKEGKPLQDDWRRDL